MYNASSTTSRTQSSVESSSTSRVDKVLNDPIAAARPELAKADRAMASELPTQQAALDKTALRQQAVKKAEEAKIVAETLARRTLEITAEADRQMEEMPLSTTDSVDQSDSSSKLKARVPNDARPSPFEEDEANDTRLDRNRTDSAQTTRAEAFKREVDPVVGTHSHPELAGAYAVVAAIDRKVAIDGVSPKAKRLFAPAW